MPQVCALCCLPEVAGELVIVYHFPAAFSSPFAFPIAQLVFSGAPPRKITFAQILLLVCSSGDPDEDSYQIGANSKRFLLLTHLGNFEGGVPYRVTVTAVSPRGLAPAPPVWSFREELGKR